MDQSAGVNENISTSNPSHEDNSNKDDWTVDGPSAVGNLSEFGFNRLLNRAPENLATSKQAGNESAQWFSGLPGVAQSAWPEDGEKWPEPVKAIESISAIPNMPHPGLILPTPSLKIDFRMAVTLNPRVSVGMTPLGHRNWISFVGGSWAASFGSGTVLPGGQDSQIIVANGSARIETHYLLSTHDSPPAYIVVKTEGWRTGPKEVLEALADPERADSVDPSAYSFRLFIRLETGDERYADAVNYGMWIGSGMRKDREVIYDAYRVS